jgi:hypothetical protein
MKMTDDLDVTLNELDCLIDEWEEASVVQVTFETSFKSWESAQKTALMDSGLSAVRAEAQIRGSEEWSKYFGDLQMQNIRVEKKRKQIEACKLRFKAAQTYRVDARTMTEF